MVRNSTSLMKLWENASEEEKTAGILLSEFQLRSNKSLVNAYFDFADKWNDVFPKQNKKMYDKGMKAVKKGAKLAGVGEKTVYSVLRVARFYGRAGYDALAKKAESNGVSIMWVHLRTIAIRLSENKEARTKIEQIITQKSMTESQLNALIDEMAPSSKNKRLESSDGVSSAGSSGSGEKPTVISSFISTVSVFRNFAKNREKYLKTITDVNDELSDDTEQAKIVNEQLITLIGCFQEIHAFLEENVAFVQQMRDAADILASAEEGKRKVAEAAKATQRQIAHEKEEQKKKRAAKEAANAERGAPASDINLADDPDEEEEEDSDWKAVEEAADDDDIDVGDVGDAEFWNEAGHVK